MCVLVSGFSYRTFPYAKNRLAESGKKLFLGNVLVTFAKKKFHFMTTMDTVKVWDNFPQFTRLFPLLL